MPFWPRLRAAYQNCFVLNFNNLAIVSLSSHNIQPVLLFSKNRTTYFSCYATQLTQRMELKEVVRKLQKFAPTTLAGSWDNVGLLLEPTPPHTVSKMLLTNDLTEAVADEALEMHANFIISYHPPIFSPLKCLTQRTWKERILVKCLEHRIAVYSPHTTYDAVEGGVNDWLIQPFEGLVEPLETVISPSYPTPGAFHVNFSAENQSVHSLMEHLKIIPGVTLLESNCGDMDKGVSKVHMNCTQKALNSVVRMINQHQMILPTLEIIQLNKPPVPGHGPGRFVKLQKPISIEAAVDKVKEHLQLNHVSVALACSAKMDTLVKSVAVCAGSGSSVLRGVKADLWITGEMSHHELLDANHSKTSVILCQHSNTERGYFSILSKKLTDLFDHKVEIEISTSDKDPITIV